MRSIRTLQLSFFILCCTAWNVTAQLNVEINSGENAFIGRSMEYFVDTSHLGINEILTKKFSPGQSDILNFGNSPYSIWMRFGLSSKTESKVYLEIMAPLLTKLEIYKITNGLPVQIFKGGFLQNFKERPVKLENWLLSLDVKKDTSTVYYMNCESYYPLQVPISISAKERYV